MLLWITALLTAANWPGASLCTQQTSNELNPVSCRKGIHNLNYSQMWYKWAIHSRFDLSVTLYALWFEFLTSDPFLFK